MTETIPLITNPDGFEVVRNAIANIISTELTAQQAQAVTLGLDADPWKMKVYYERANAWESMRNESGFVQPIVNVWYESSTLSERESNAASRVMQSTYNIDILGHGVSEETATGHSAGDKAAIIESQRATRIVRQILAHPKYALLGLGRSVVGWRKIQTRRGYRPATDESPVDRIMGMNLELVVSHAETVPFETLTGAASAIIEIKHAVDGAVLAELQYTWIEEEE